MDEHLYHADLLNYLKQRQKIDITAIPGENYQMVPDSFPDSDQRSHLIVRGMHYKKMDKLCLYNSSAIEEANFIPGRLKANFNHQVVFPKKRISNYATNNTWALIILLHAIPSFAQTCVASILKNVGAINAYWIEKN